MKRKMFFKTAACLSLCLALAAGGAEAFAANTLTRKGGAAMQTPRIVETVYPSADIVVADIVATEAPYFADPAGKQDSTAAIQSAVNDCFDAGGGTVFLPAGEYLVTAGITVNAFVTLRGDWQDPDTGNSYGTVINAAVPSSPEDLPALFTVMGSAGVMGLTVYYPEQNIDAVKPYPYTFYVPGSGGQGFMLQNIVNCTVLNGYKGIAACVNNTGHEMMTIDNVKGTFLFCGAAAYNQSDVGTWKNLTVDNKYWAEAPGGRSAPLEKISAYTRKNATGLVLGDLEWTQFANIRIADRKTGIHIVKGKRIDFAGSLFDVTVERCGTGLLVDAIDERWGMVAAKSSFHGSEHAVVNNSLGVVKMADVKLTGGPLCGKYKYTDFGHFFRLLKDFFRQGFTTNSKFLCDNTSLRDIKVNYAAAPPKPAPNLYVLEADKTGTADAAGPLQTLLDTAGQTGGVVYLPAGKYRLNAPVTVPAGVELRGSSSVAARDQGGLSLGTVIFACYGLDAARPNKDTAQITLKENAGVRGLRIVYPGNSSTVPGALGTVRPCTYAIRGTGSGVYAVNVAIAAAYNGIDFRGCDNHIVNKLVSCCYHNTVFAGDCEGGVIEGCLQNGTVIVRNGLKLPNWPDEGTQLFPYIFETVTRVRTNYIKLNNAKNQTVFNCFAYGVKTLVNNTGSENLLAFNVGADNVGGTLFITKGGDARVINMMRWNGSSFTNDGTRLLMLNRLTIGDRTEKTVKL